MTRGSFYLFMPNRVLESIEFNGDMYPDGHGDDALTALRPVKTEKEFRTAIEKFNSTHHQYDTDKLVYIQKKKSTNFAHGYFDLNNSETCYFSDWIFIKNLSGKSIAFDMADGGEPVIVGHGKTVRFKYGNVPDEKDLMILTLEECPIKH